MRPLLTLIALLATSSAAGQTVVEMELEQAEKLLQDHGLGSCVPLLAQLSNKCHKTNNVRVQSRQSEEAVTTLARALRTDFDGSGSDYIPELTVWAVLGESGARVYLSASLADADAVLMASDIDYLKGMIAHEILGRVRDGSMTLADAQHKAMTVGIEMQVSEDNAGARTITFFGHRQDQDWIIGKLMVIEPPDFVWK